ncbi:teratocarcinoma-derived growth factor [Plakobranchus ocellatus]|uniref:Teratocarcinoma-derived growth factor n=1 Tax=Plakobranchus ocellatus TaxID=259542 RepID=A0AAV4ARC8_9GAST|nr:teratocarcinoma-derived growth factor [Plakobranchus ocellatus]
MLLTLLVFFRKYYGFRCEYERVPCGPIQHEQWARLGCHLCRCFDARLHCLTNVYHGCEGKPVKEDIQVSDYEDELEIYPMDNEIQANEIGDYQTDDYYYYDDYDSFDYSYTNDKGKGGSPDSKKFKTRNKGKHRRKDSRSASAVMVLSSRLSLLCLCFSLMVCSTRIFLFMSTTFFVS